MSTKSNKRFLSFFIALTFLFGIVTTPVYASTQTTESIKKAYISTLETRTTWGDMEDICKNNVDYETAYKDYYKAKNAYDENSEDAYYGLVYTISSKSSKNSSTAYGKPADSVEYSVVGSVNGDGDKEVTIYKCKTTTWLKKISGEYKITKVLRNITTLSDYESDIADEAIVSKIEELSKNYIDEGETAEADTDGIDTIGSVESEITHNDTVTSRAGIVTSSSNLSNTPKLTIGMIQSRSNNSKLEISGKLTDKKGSSPNLRVGSYVETASSDVVTIKGTVRDSSGITPALYINGETVPVNSTNGAWSKTINLTSGENIIVIKAENSLGKETIITKKIKYTRN